MTQAPGKTFLKVVGIILIVTGVLGAIVSLLALAGGGLAGLGIAAGVEGLEEGTEAAAAAALVGGLFLIVGIVGLVGSIFDLVAGILGVKNANLPEKAGICVIMGVIMLALEAIGIVVSLVSGGVDGGMVASWAFGLVLPVLYLVGALKNKNAAQ